MQISKYQFTYPEVRRNCSTPEKWQKFVRETEFSLIAKTLNLNVKKALELGAGDGGQSVVISQHCEHLVCTELAEYGNRLGAFKARNIPNCEYKYVDATDLSQFPDQSFDLVYSSNMLEHVPNWQRVLFEANRVLRSGGVMIHVMPSRQWKFWYWFVSVFLKHEPPLIHGTESTHAKEFHAFGERVWEQKIESVCLNVIQKIRLPFYFGHGPSPLWLIKLGNTLGWSSSTAYVIKPAC